MNATLGATVQLSNGVHLPSVGLGTFRARGEEVQQAVAWALQEGVRHIDTASIYKNEAQVHAAVAQSGVPRSQVFITSKVSPYQQGTDKALAACRQSLQLLGGLDGIEGAGSSSGGSSSRHESGGLGPGLAAIDCMLVHWPGAAKTDSSSADNARLRLETWRVLETLYLEGRFRSIGVSNYCCHHLQELWDVAKVKPMVNQIEVHPRLQQREVRQLCSRLGVAVVAYASLGTGQLLGQAEVKEVAAECGKTPAQVLLRWGLQEGCAVIPKSVTYERIRQQTPAELLMGWELSEGQKACLDGMQDGTKFCWDPSDIL